MPPSDTTASPNGEPTVTKRVLNTDAMLVKVTDRALELKSALEQSANECSDLHAQLSAANKKVNALQREGDEVQHDLEEAAARQAAQIGTSNNSINTFNNTNTFNNSTNIFFYTSTHSPETLTSLPPAAKRLELEAELQRLEMELARVELESRVKTAKEQLQKAEAKEQARVEETKARAEEVREKRM